MGILQKNTSSEGGGNGEIVKASLRCAMAACSAAAGTKWSRESRDWKGVGGEWEEGQGGGNGDSKDSGAREGRQCKEK